MPVQAQYEAKLRVPETFVLGLDNVTDPSSVHEIIEVKGTLNATSTPPATMGFSDDRALAAGADALDLTALPGPLGTTIDFTGLKVQLVKIVALAANTDRILVEPAATNGYNLFGAATAEVSLGPGEAVLLAMQDSLPDVGAGAKDLAFSSADVDAGYEIILVAG